MRPSLSFCLCLPILATCAPAKPPTPASVAPPPAAAPAVAPAAVHPLVAAARAQVGVCVTYDPAYAKLAFPMGDVQKERGVCCDVVIRALREAKKLDLQAQVNADMRPHFDAYPKTWGLRRPDANIDHRRVPNLETWMRRQGWELPAAAALVPGDIVTCRLNGTLPHIMLVADPARDAAGQLRVLHNIGGGTREEAVGFALTGRFRTK
jgi:uncharacterized protein YijF (DUF1287 family)